MYETSKYEVQESGLMKLPIQSRRLDRKEYADGKWIQNVNIVVVQCDLEEIEFDIIGIVPGMANTFRRIMMSDIPSMAIEKVHIITNTSIIPDDELSHMFGLIPLRADARLFRFKSDSDSEDGEENALEFEVKVKCTLTTDNSKNSLMAEDMFINDKVYSKSIKWVPIGNQAEKLYADDVGPIHPDILISKLRPGHEIDCKLIAHKGTGKDHAKFSPVESPCIRLHPEVEITEEITGEAAVRLQKCFAKGVIDIVECNGKEVAVVKNARYETGARNHFKHPDLKDKVIVRRKENHVIFNYTTMGALNPPDIFLESVRFLEETCLQILETIKQDI